MLQPAPETVEQTVEVRLARQNLLTRPDPPHLLVILDEAVLHRTIGGPPVMQIQLERLTEVAEWPNVTLQVIPFSRGAHPGVNGAFNVLEFADPVPGVAYTEDYTGFFYREKPAEVKLYHKIFDLLRTAALGEADSIEFIAGIRSGIH
jgi:hypothetical protein